MKKRSFTFCAATLIVASQHVIAEINWSASGFASISVGSTFDGKEIYPITTNDDDDVIEYNQHANFQPNTKAAIQVSADIGSDLTFVTQFLSEGRDNYKTETEWLYLSYDINDDMRVNVGRIVLPLFFYSDYKKVGYAYDWLRLPGSVYTEGFDNFEGVSFLHNTYIGELESNLQVSSNLDDFHGISWTGTYEWLTFHGALYYASLSNPAVDTAVSTAAQFTTSAAEASAASAAATTAAATAGAAQAEAAANGDTAIAASYGAEVAAQTEIATTQGGAALVFADAAADLTTYASDNQRGEDILFGNLAVRASFDDFYVLAEGVKITFDPGYLVGDIDAAYLTAGYLFNELTLHATYGISEQELGSDAEAFLTKLTSTEVAPGVVIANDAGAALTGIVAAADSEVQETTLGMRYNINSSTAFKFEVTQRDDKKINENDVTLFITGIDLVF